METVLRLLLAGWVGCGVWCYIHTKKYWLQEYGKWSNRDSLIQLFVGLLGPMALPATLSKLKLKHKIRYSPIQWIGIKDAAKRWPKFKKHLIDTGQMDEKGEPTGSQIKRKD